MLPEGFLTKQDMLADEYVKKIIDPYDPNAVEQWSYKLSMGSEAYISSGKEILRLKDGESIRIEPGETALLLTKERLKMELDLGAFIALRFAKKRKGLINVSGFHVDPGFEGKLLYSVYNAGPEPVFVREGEPVFSIYFVKLARETEARSNNAQHQGIDGIKSEWAEDIAGPPVSLITIHQKVERLQHLVNGIIWLFGGLLLAGLSVLLSLLVIQK